MEVSSCARSTVVQTISVSPTMPYVRLLPTKDVQTQLAAFMDSLEKSTAWRDKFYSQLHPAACLGCHPFHVTVLGGVREHSQVEVQDCLIAPAWMSIITVETVRWNLTSMGSLQLLVRCTTKSSIENLSKLLKQSLPRAKIWRAKFGLFHITCGILQGSRSNHGNFLRFVQSKVPSLIGARLQLEALEFETDDMRPNLPVVMLQSLDKLWQHAYQTTKSNGELHPAVQQLRNELPPEQYRKWLDFNGHSSGYTILHQCAWHGATHSAQTLLSLGASCSIKNYREETAIQTALRMHGEAWVQRHCSGMQPTQTAPGPPIPLAPAATTTQTKQFYDKNEILLLPKTQSKSVPAPLQTIAATNARQLVILAHTQASALKSMPVCGHMETGRGKLVPANKDKFRKQLQTLHDTLEEAFAQHPSTVLQTLAVEANAHRHNIVAGAGKAWRWRSGLQSLHVDVKTGPSAATSCDPHVPAIFCPVKRSAHKCYSGPKHTGHQDTRSALLCHVSDHGTRIFFSVHLNPDPFCHAGLVPVDERYFHVLIAYLEPHIQVL